MNERDFRTQRAFWLRCRVQEAEREDRNYDISPSLSNVVATSWGGSAWATHASAVREEVLGRSDGSPGQILQVEHTPLLRRAAHEVIEVRGEGQEIWEKWSEVPSFADSGPFDKHYTCDSVQR